MKKCFELSAEFLLDDDWETNNDLITKTVGKLSCSSGAGLGMRDMQFTFATKEQAEKIKTKINKLKIPKLSVKIYERK